MFMERGKKPEEPNCSEPQFPHLSNVWVTFQIVKVCMISNINSFNKYLLKTYYGPHTVLGSGKGQDGETGIAGKEHQLWSQT